MFHSPFFSRDPGFENFDVFGFFFGELLGYFRDFGQLGLGDGGSVEFIASPLPPVTPPLARPPSRATDLLPTRICSRESRDRARHNREEDAL